MRSLPENSVVHDEFSLDGSRGLRFHLWAFDTHHRVAVDREHIHVRPAAPVEVLALMPGERLEILVRLRPHRSS